MGPETPRCGIPLVGLAREYDRILQAIHCRESLAVIGPAGSGKSRLLELAARETGAIRVASSPVPHRLLTAVAAALAEAGDPTLRSAAGSEPSGAWLSRQTSRTLRGLLWSALERTPRSVLLEGFLGPSATTYRFFQRLIYTPGVALVVAARSTANLGAAARLFWDPRRRLELPPLSEAEARELFRRCADYFELRGLELDAFRERALASARGNPGEIVEMCRLAASPRYHSGRHIKFAPLRIDALARVLARG